MKYFKILRQFFTDLKSIIIKNYKDFLTEFEKINLNLETDNEIDIDDELIIDDETLQNSYLYNTKHDNFLSIELYQNIQSKDEFFEYLKNIIDSKNYVKLNIADIIKYTGLTEWRIKSYQRDLILDEKIKIRDKKILIIKKN